MRARFAVIAFFALTALGCEDDARDLDHLKPHPVPIEASTPDAGSDDLTVPDASAVDSGSTPITTPDASSNDAGAEDAG